MYDFLCSKTKCCIIKEVMCTLSIYLGRILGIQAKGDSTPGLKFGTKGDLTPGLQQGFESTIKRCKSNAVANRPWNVLTDK